MATLLYIACAVTIAGTTIGVLARKQLLAPLSVVTKSVFYIVLPPIASVLAGRPEQMLSFGQLAACLAFLLGALVAALFCRPVALGSVESLREAASALREQRSVDQSLILIACVLLFALNVAFTLQYDLLVRRIGTELIAAVYADLPAYVRVTLRLWEVLLVALITFLAFDRRLRLGLFARVAVTLMWVSVFVFLLASSRLFLIDMFLVAMVVYGVRANRMVFIGGPVALVLAGGTYLYRSDFSLQKASEDFWSQWVERLDCFSLLGEIDQRMWAASPPLLGEPWIASSFGRLRAIIDPQFQSSYLAAGETGSKNAISSEFGLGRGPDYPSCMLSDAYANFWILGALLLGILLVLAAARLEGAFARAESVSVRAACIGCLGVLIVFDRDVSDAVLNLGVSAAIPLSIFFGASLYGAIVARARRTQLNTT